MAGSKRLAAFRASAPHDDEELPDPVLPGEDGEDETEPTPSEEEENDMSEITQAAVDAAREDGRKAGYDEGIKAANQRMAMVFASDHFAGREAHAAKLLGMEMKAEDIVTLLADYPKAEAVEPLTEEQRAEAEKTRIEAAEKAGRDEMRAELDKNKPSGIDPGTGGEGNGEATAQTKASRILADHAAFTGRKPKAAATA